MHTIYFSLGSNIGDKEGNLCTAISKIDKKIGEVVAVSTLRRTTPVGYVDQPDFYNAACKVITTLEPQAVLEEVENIMRDMGRVRNILNGPRSIDIDILLYDDVVIEKEDLVIPHPRMLERRFVIEPLCEIGEDLVHPVTRKTMREYLEMLI